MSPTNRGLSLCHCTCICMVHSRTILTSPPHPPPLHTRSYTSARFWDPQTCWDSSCVGRPHRLWLNSVSKIPEYIQYRNKPLENIELVNQSAPLPLGFMMVRARSPWKYMEVAKMLNSAHLTFKSWLGIQLFWTLIYLATPMHTGHVSHMVFTIWLNGYCRVL